MACGGGGLASELNRLRALVTELEAQVCRCSPAAGELCGALAATVDRVIVRVPGCVVSAQKGRWKKRKGTSEERRQVRVRSVQDDGLGWRKYGQKDILGAKHPRSYFRCTHRHTQGCHAAKQVQRADADPLLFDVVYLGEHTCAAHRVVGMPTPTAEKKKSSPGIHKCVEPMTPFAFPSSPAGSSAFDCCFPLASPSSSDCQISSTGGYDSAAAMDFDAQLDDWLLNPSDFFQPEIQNL